MTSTPRPRLRAATVLTAAAVLATGCAATGDVTADDAPSATPAPPTTSAPSPTGAPPTPTPPVTAPSPSPSPAPPPAPLQALALETVVSGLSEPVHAAAPPGDDRVYVVERAGRIVVTAGAGAVRDEPFLDIRDEVHADSSIEQGLYSVAFHPDYAEDGRIYVMHALPSNDNQVVEYRADPEAAMVDPSSARVLLTIDKEPDKVRHNGGQLAFGPDGFLYVSVGDGARASVNGQDPSTLLGAILRIDVDSGDPYDVPESNPFADGDGGAPEVWAYGFRNPWRFAIDPLERRVWIGDVGQETAEEVDVAPLDSSGLNFGWPIREGEGEFYGGEPDGPLTDPVLSLDHQATPACSITGGVVYRGAAIPELDGDYLFADWCIGWIKRLVWDGQAVQEVVDLSDQLPAQMVSSFGTDGNGEALVVDYAAGTVSRIVPVR
jgi:glucose/arabinose dehydrogenase